MNKRNCLLAYMHLSAIALARWLVRWHEKQPFQLRYPGRKLSLERSLEVPVAGCRRVRCRSVSLRFHAELTSDLTSLERFACRTGRRGLQLPSACIIDFHVHLQIPCALPNNNVCNSGIASLLLGILVYNLLLTIVRPDSHERELSACRYHRSEPQSLS